MSPAVSVVLNYNMFHVPRGHSHVTRSVEVYIHRSSPTLRGIVVLVFTKSDG